MDKIKKNKGFSIGEVILSVFIMSVGILATFQLFIVSARDIMDERDSIIASMLAQEGIELVRNIRDNNWADRTCPIKSSCASGWVDTFANLPIANNNNCRVDINSSEINATNDCGSASKILNLDVNNRYVHSAGTATKFRRRIAFIHSNAGTDDETVDVRSFVSWDNSDPDSITECNIENKCIFSRVILRNWGTGS